jgi:ketosteroid isomerase-like protein
MSQEDVEAVRGVFESFEAGLDRSDPVAFFDLETVPDDYEVIVRQADAIEGRTIWRGREGFLEFYETWAEQFEDLGLRVERLIDAGDDRVVALTRFSGVGKRSRAPVELTLGQVFELEEGRLVRVTYYLTYEEALEAAGLRE